MRLLIPALAGALLAGAGLAAPRALTLPGSLALARSQGPELATAATALASARTDLARKKADPTTLADALLQSQNAFELAQAEANLTRLTVAQSVTTAYANLYEGQENVKVLSAQLALDERNLAIARAKLAARSGTQLDVSRAQATLNSARQNLADARAQLPILAARLAPLLGLAANAELAAAAPPYAQRSLSLAPLEAGLASRLPSVIQAANAVEAAQLAVKLADNDYTPAATLTSARSTLQNATRSLDTARKSAATALRDAYRQVGSALEAVNLRTRELANARAALAQDGTRFKAGTISRVTLQASEVAVTSSQYALSGARNAYLEALAALSVAAGVDVTGLGGSA